MSDKLATAAIVAGGRGDDLGSRLLQSAPGIGSVVRKTTLGPSPVRVTGRELV